VGGVDSKSKRRLRASSSGSSSLDELTELVGFLLWRSKRQSDDAQGIRKQLVLHGARQGKGSEGCLGGRGGVGRMKSSCGSL